jgi:tetratricopeptide (TPR) repeat protein
MGADWFRNKTWSSDIERSFDEKLRRARRKGQYLRIQAYYLAKSHPKVALELLDRYFSLNDHSEDASAYTVQATAFLTQGRVEDAVESYRATLSREAEFPNLVTQAYLDLPYLIATLRIRDKYDEAVSLLDRHKSRLMFPVDHFRWHAATSLIAAARGNLRTAKDHAKYAIEAAAVDHSGFRYHPTVGLVTEQYDDLIHKLRSLGGL